MRSLEAHVRRAASADLSTSDGQALVADTKSYFSAYAEEVRLERSIAAAAAASASAPSVSASNARVATISRPSPSAMQMLLGWPRTALRQLLYLVIINLFGLFARLRFIYRAILYRAQSLLRYHHYKPEIIRRDVETFEKIPNHLSAILPSPPVTRRRAPTKSGPRFRADSTVGIEQLLNDAGELTAWSASIGVRTLSIYEKTGVLKSDIAGTYDGILQRLEKYFPPEAMPHLTVRVPNVPSYSRSVSGASTPQQADFNTDPTLALAPDSPSRNITVLLISAEDGRDTIVDLTRTLTSMVQKGKLTPRDISIQLINLEMCESIMDEPDLLICFTEDFHLNGYPPWHLRLTEIFHLPDHTSSVTYNVFLQALQMFNGSSFRFGK